jgi:CRISPR system Cascade subunit CasA
MTYDLRFENWLPFRRRSGVVEWLPPWMITDGYAGDNPIVALAAPRPDFNGALHEFLIGLYSVALALYEVEDWRDAREVPPTPEVLKGRLSALPAAFNLDGDGPRFLQDFTVIDFEGVRPTPIENLLIDAAGENTQKLNKDLFVKRDRVSHMGRAAAAMALLTLQTYAPSGGQGHRTSMRGGGPLTTLVDPRADGGGKDEAHNRPLWEMISANLVLPEGRTWVPKDWTKVQVAQLAPKIWPWLTSTQTSNPKLGGKQTYIEDTHPMQAFFGMPRRLRLEFEYRTSNCDLLDQSDDVSISEYRALNFGTDYGSGNWMHPLSPHYSGAGNTWLPVHPQPDGVGWKDWAGLVMDQNDKKGTSQRIAETIRFFGKETSQKFAVRVFGYDMDNMKARGWADATLPAWPTSAGQSESQLAVQSAASQMVEASRLACNLVVGQILAAKFNRKEDAKGDFSHIKADMWARLEQAFYSRIDKSMADGDTNPQIISTPFLSSIEATAFDVFDAYVDLDTLDVVDAHRVVLARRDLKSSLLGFGKGGAALFAALGLPAPDKGKNRNKEATI